MGLDITIKIVKKNVCPHCGKPLDGEVVACEDSGGRIWTPFLKKVGYYVDYEERTEENDWYGKDMVLTAEQAKYLFEWVGAKEPYNAGNICGMVASAVLGGEDVIVNADW